MKKFAILAALTVSFIIISLINASPVSALIVSPPLLDVQAEPGETVTGSFNVQNNDKFAQDISLNVFDLEYTNEDYQPELFDANRSSSPPGVTLASWISLNRTELFLEESTKEEVNFTIDVPADAPAGTYWAVAAVSSTDEPTRIIENIDSEVSVGRLLGYLFLLTITGDNTQEPELIEFSLEPDYEIFGMKIIETYPAEFEVILGNYGNSYFQPSGVIVLSEGGREPFANLRVNQDAGRVLPDHPRSFAVRYLEDEQSYLNWRTGGGSSEFIDYYLSNTGFGRYKAELSLDARVSGGDSVVYNRTVTYFVFPVRLVVLVIALTLSLALIFLARRLYNRKKRTNELQFSHGKR